MAIQVRSASTMNDGDRGPRRRSRVIDDLIRDSVYAFRQLRRSPGFTALAVLCLGLGIGVNTAMFGVLDTVLLRPMAVTHADRLVMLGRDGRATFSYPAFEENAARSRVLEAMAASLPMESDLDVDGESEFVAAEVVSEGYGDVLGIRPPLGRWFTSDSEPAAVISYAVWQRRFHGGPDVLGRVVRSESQSYTIVGVAPAEFTGVFAPLRTDIWVPVRTRPTLGAWLENRDRQAFMLFGRLASGATALQASAELNAIDRQLAAERGPSLEIAPPIVTEQIRGIPHPANRLRARTLATFLSAVAVLVLLIACVNVGNLLLARGGIRQRELAMRRALGATRSRVVRQLLTESLVLSFAGGACGVVLAGWINQLLERTLPAVAGFAVQLNLALDWRALTYGLVLTLVTTMMCGLLPAWRSSNAPDLAAFTGSIAIGPARRPLGLIAQVVMSLTLLLAAGTFLQTVAKMQHLDPGFAVANRLFAHTFIPTPPFTRESGLQFYSQAIDRLQALPGVRRAALGYYLPLMPAPSDCTTAGDGTKAAVSTGVVDAGYFQTLNIPLMSGRDFDPDDRPGSEPVVIVNETLAGRLWPNGQAVGERLAIGCRDAKPARVVGVVHTTAVRRLDEPPQPHLFLPLTQHYSGGLTTIVVETTAAPEATIEPVRRALRELGQGIRVYATRSMSDHVDASYLAIRWQASIVTTIGMVALALAAIGFYGLIAYRVAQRTPEIGVRMALGAGRPDIFREVVVHALSTVFIGVAAGELLSVLLSQMLGSLRPDVPRPGAGVYVGTAAIWIAVALVASYVPASRASRTNPLEALRRE
jgi:predicted permease